MTKALRKTMVCLLVAITALSLTMTVLFAVRGTSAFADNVTEKVVLFTGDNDYTQGDSLPAKVNGQTSASGLIQNGFGWLELATLQPSDHTGYPALIDLDALREDITGNALGVQIGNWGISHYNKILFNTKVNAALTESVTFRIYANLSPDKVPYACNAGTDTFTLNTQGIFIYGVNANGEYGEGILIEPTVTQNEWVNITVEADELWKLADDNGYIGGFSVASAIYADTSSGFYVTEAHATTWADTVAGPDQGAIIFIDTVTANNVTEAGSSAIPDGGYVDGAGRTFTVRNGAIEFTNGFGKVYSYAYTGDEIRVLTQSGLSQYSLSDFESADKVVITCYSGYGDNAEIGKYEAVKNTALAISSEPKREGYRFLYWSLGVNGEKFEGTVSGDISLYAVWEEKKEITTANDDYEKGSDSITAIEGKTAMGGGVTSFVPGGDWDYMDLGTRSEANLTKIASGTDDNMVFGTLLSGWGFTVRNAIMFKQAVDVNEVQAITFRIYAHLSASDTYLLNSNGEIAHESLGLYLYGAGKTGAEGEGVLVPYNVAQDKWIDFTVSEADLLKMATDGKIEGFALACGAVNGGDNNIFYEYKGSYENTAFILIDYVLANGYATVTYKDGDTTLKTDDKALTGMKIDSEYIPQKSGYIFAGWLYNVPDGRVFGYDESISGDTVFYADWKQEGDLSGKEGLYENGDKWVMVFGNGEFNFSESFGRVYYAAYASDGKLYVLTGTGREEITLDSANKAESNLVTYYGKDESDVVAKIYVKSGSLAPELQVESTVQFNYWSEEPLGKPFDFQSGVPSGGKLYAVWTYTREDFMFSDGANGYALGEKSDLSMIAGDSSLNGGTVSDKFYYHVTGQTVSEMGISGSVNDTAFCFYALNWGFTFGSPVYFKNPVPADELEGLTFRMYVHLSDKSPYGAFLHDGKGVRIYGIDADGSSAGVLIPIDIKQNCWIDFTLGKTETDMLKDKNGNISGFMFAAGFIADDTDIKNGYLYNFVGFDARSAFVLVDYVMANYGCTIHYVDGDGTALKDEKILTGINPADMYVPTKEGYVFTGYTLFDQPFSLLTTDICQDVKLYAQWKEARNPQDVIGLYKSKADAAKRISVTEQGIVIDGVNAIAYGVSTDGILYVTVANDVLVFDLDNDWEKVVYYDVTFISDGGSSAVQVEENNTVQAPQVVKAGYKLAGWQNERGDMFNFTTPITESVTLTAAWEEVTVSLEDYVGTNGTTYYSETDGGAITLYKEGNAVIGGKTYSFRILVSGEIIIDEFKNGTAYGPYITLEGERYVKMSGSVVVSFSVSGAEAPASQTLSDGNYIATEPESPTREGYVFKGWAYPDGTPFDFSRPVFGSVTLTATWSKQGSDETIVDPVDPSTPSVPSNPSQGDGNGQDDGEKVDDKSGCGSSVRAVSAVISAAAMLFGAAIMFVTKKKAGR